MEILGIVGLLLMVVGTVVTLTAERGSPGAIFVLFGMLLFGWQFLSPSVALSPLFAPNLITEAQVVDAVSGLYQRVQTAEREAQRLETEKADALAEKEKLEARVKFLEEATRPAPEQTRGPDYFVWVVGVFTGYLGAPAIKATWDAIKLRIKARLNQ